MKLSWKGADVLPSFQFLKSKAEIIETYVNSNDQLMLELYKDKLLLLPIRFNTLDFHKLGEKKLIDQTIEEAYLMTNSKLSDKR